MSNSGNGIHIIRKLCWFTHDFFLAKGVKKKKVGIEIQSSDRQNKTLLLNAAQAGPLLALF